MTIPGYELIEELTRNDWHALQRGRSLKDKRPVLLKVPHRQPPNHTDIELLEREFQILKDLSVAGVLRPYEMFRMNGRCCLVLEDRGGAPLHSLRGSRRPSLAFFFRISVQLCTILAELHRRKVAHRGLNPKGILVFPATGEVTLADLGLAARSSADFQALMPVHLMRGMLPYISPEQTGRMNRAIDYRTDFYSLGVILYEFLTGAPPFTSGDTLEIIHGHIAKTPPSPSHLDATIPEPLSQIVMKLLAKTAEERYQSALGLREDLQHCEQEWNSRASIAAFTLGRRDVSDRFLIPQKLYGRETELSQLLQAFEGVCEGSTAMMLVAGYSGIGKTSLIQELYKPIVRQKGYFISGKFDQVVRNIPLGALIQALRALVQQLLTESEQRLSLWRARLSEALGSTGGGVVAEVVPEIALILGEQTPPPPLGPIEAQNRFQLVFQNLLTALARRDHPLVIFLDDLQWADAATLGLLRPLLTSSDIGHLFLMGAYRDNEVDASHPLTRTLSALESAGAPIQRLFLNALGLRDLTLLIGDTLHRKLEEAEPLARLVLQKTDGNPFFVQQFLKALRQEGLLEFDYDRGFWIFQMDAIVGAAMTDNVIDLMTRKIQRLSPKTQRALTLASCIGNPFDLSTLAIVSQQSRDAAANDLQQVFDEQLLLPAAPSYDASPEQSEDVAHPIPAYSFLHDRVQQAAYALIPDGEKQLIHGTVGRLLLERSDPAVLDEKLFDIVHHLNRGAGLITDDAERLQLARLNLNAGRKAKFSTAYEAALTYLKAGRDLLTEDSWNSDYQLMFDLQIEAAECAYLCGHFNEAQRCFDHILQRARTRLDKAQVCNLKVVQYENMSRYALAVQAGKEGLELFGVTFPDSEAGKESALEAELNGIRSILGNRTVDSLVDLPVMADPEIRLVMGILTALWAPAYILGDQALTRLISATMVRLSLTHGNIEESAYGYVTHAITVGPVRGDYESAYRFGRLALSVNERLNDRKRRAKVHQQFNAHVNLWRRPMRTCIPHAREACRSGLETGDFTYANYGAFTETWPAFLTSRDLALFVRDYSPNLQLIKKLKMDSFVDAQKVILNWARALQGLTSSALQLTAEDFDEDAYVRAYSNNPFFMTFLYVVKLHLSVLFEEYEKAYENARNARQVIHSLGGTIWPVLLDFLYGVTLAARCSHAGHAERRDSEQELQRLAKSLAFLAENCPENFRCYSLLLGAELERVCGHEVAAMDTYQEALRYARETQNLPNEAIANELYARYWLQQSNEEIAALYLRRARRLYQEWGAAAKVKALEEKYPNLLARDLLDSELTAFPAGSGCDRDEDESGRRGAPAPADRAATQGRPYGGTSPGEPSVAGIERDPQPSPLDISTVSKAAHAIAVEIVLEDLLRKLMKIALENAGAQRGFFLREENGALRIEAEGAVDRDEVRVLEATRLEERSDLFSQAVVHYVRKTGESIVLGNAPVDERFSGDPYICSARPKSILCVPVVHQGKFGGILYLENNLTTDAFTADRIRIMHILSSQAAISLTNARLYAEMKQEVALRRRAEEELRAALAEVETLKNRLRAENIYLQEEIRREHNFEEIVGSSPALLDLLGQVERVAPTDSTVLIYGETGTGKELIARAIHARSARRDRPLVKVNCGAISAGLVESELFGHVKGAFTGAITARTGRFELANGGTLFLDEVSELPLETQVKLLRVLQEQEFEPVGSSRTLRVDVRIIAASNRDLAQAVAAGQLRADLYYRLNVFPLTIPPLRERQSDIPQLVTFFLTRFAKRIGKKIDKVAQDTMDLLASYSWPGNIRELQNVLQRAAVLSTGPVLKLERVLFPTLSASPSLSPSAMSAEPPGTHAVAQEVAVQADHASSAPGSGTLEDVERHHILSVLEKSAWVIEGPRGAAKILNLHPNTLRSRMKKLGIHRRVTRQKP